MSNPHILVVEDEAIVAKNIQLELSSMGYAVPAVAASGEEALQKVAEIHPDLVLMDIGLKGAMDGVETTQRMQERFDVPVVYLTSYADERTLQRAKETGPFGYLVKPYEERELQTTIEIALHKHKTEVARRQMQQWLAATLRCIGAAVIAADARGCISMLNPAAEALTGWSQQEALGKELLEVVPVVKPGTRAPVANPLTRALREGNVSGLEKGSVLLAKDGKEIPVEGSIAPVYDEHGSFSGFVALLRDISLRNPTEGALGQSAGDIRPRQEMEILAARVGGLAHDFNQLLTVILGNVSFALGQLPQDDPNHELLANVEKAALQAAALAKQLLDFSRRAQVPL